MKKKNQPTHVKMSVRQTNRVHLAQLLGRIRAIWRTQPWVDKNDVARRCCERVLAHLEFRFSKIRFSSFPCKQRKKKSRLGPFFFVNAKKKKRTSQFALTQPLT